MKGAGPPHGMTRDAPVRQTPAKRDAPLVRRAPGRRDAPLARQAPAKLNLALEVIGRRPDGFHELRSVFAPLALHDDLEVRVLAHGGPDPSTAAPGPAPDRLRVLGAPDVPVDGNLVLRAATLARAALAEVSAGSASSLAFALRKRIPAAAGLGGGSSDALAALDLALAAWGREVSARERLELAARLGSDVPYFAYGGWALVRGRGERVEPVPAPAGGPLGVVLVVPATRLATREVFEACDAMPIAPGRHSGSAERLAAALRAGVPVAHLVAIQPSNDLAPAAERLLPELGPLRLDLAALLGLPVHLTGSGPALALLYASPGEAASAARRVVVAARRGRLRPPGGTLRVIATQTSPVEGGGRA